MRLSLGICITAHITSQSKGKNKLRSLLPSRLYVVFYLLSVAKRPFFTPQIVLSFFCNIAASNLGCFLPCPGNRPFMNLICECCITSTKQKLSFPMKPLITIDFFLVKSLSFCFKKNSSFGYSRRAGNLQLHFENPLLFWAGTSGPSRSLTLPLMLPVNLNLFHSHQHPGICPPLIFVTQFAAIWQLYQSLRSLIITILSVAFTPNFSCTLVLPTRLSCCPLQSIYVDIASSSLAPPEFSTMPTFISLP